MNAPRTDPSIPDTPLAVAATLASGERLARGESGAALEVSVVMPCLNEARTVARCVERALETLRAHGVSGEVIVSDNGSTDGSQALAESAGARVVTAAERGYGSALASGFAAARGQFIVMGDSDASYDFGQLPALLERLRAGHDLVVGNRFRGGIRQRAMPLSHRYLGNPALTALGRLLYRSPCGDIYCGLRGLRADRLPALNLHSAGMEFALEMVVKAQLLGLSICEVPVTLDPDGRDRKPHLRTWRDGWRSLRFLLTLSPNWLFLYPGLALILLGLSAGAVLLRGALELGSARLDVHTLLYCSAAVGVGVQLVIFALLAKSLGAALGVLPGESAIVRRVRRLSPEAGMIAGLALALVGVALGATAFSGWARGGFGDLDPFQTLRVVIPSALCLTVGVQILFASFFLSLLRLPMRGQGSGAA